MKKNLYSQCYKVYSQANMLIRKFAMCSESVKCSLFRTYIALLYIAQLWSSYKKKTLQWLKVACNDGMRCMLCIPRWHSSSQLFVARSNFRGTIKAAYV